MSKIRELRCATCGDKWEEPMRPGARPWECPKCNPGAAKRREVERERAARKAAVKAAPDLGVDVPNFMRPALERMLDLAADFPQPGREELARQVRQVAMAQGHLALREELIKLSALCMVWAAWLPDTVSVPQPEEPAAHAA